MVCEASFKSCFADFFIKPGTIFFAAGDCSVIQQTFSKTKPLIGQTFSFKQLQNFRVL